MLYLCKIMGDFSVFLALHFLTIIPQEQKTAHVISHLTLKTEQRTSAEPVSKASSPVTFLRRSMRMVGGIISQYLEVILQTPSIPVERTIG